MLRRVAPKRQFLQEAHGVTSQKTPFFKSHGICFLHSHQLMAYADDVNLLGSNIDTINKNTQTLIDASKEVGL
jgi:hypothetical protein